MAWSSIRKRSCATFAKSSIKPSKRRLNRRNPSTPLALQRPHAHPTLDLLPARCYHCVKSMAKHASAKTGAERENNDLPSRLLAHLKRDGYIRAGERIAVAVSGGADSVALLLLLLELREKIGIVLSVVHFNHQLRGRASDGDQKFVASLAARHSLEFHVQTGDVAARAKNGKINLEAPAPPPAPRSPAASSTPARGTGAPPLIPQAIKPKPFSPTSSAAPAWPASAEFIRNRTASSARCSPFTAPTCAPTCVLANKSGAKTPPIAIPPALARAFAASSSRSSKGSFNPPSSNTFAPSPISPEKTTRTSKAPRNCASALWPKKRAAKFASPRAI